MKNACWKMIESERVRRIGEECDSGLKREKKRRKKVKRLWAEELLMERRRREGGEKRREEGEKTDRARAGELYTRAGSLIRARAAVRFLVGLVFALSDGASKPEIALAQQNQHAM